MWRAAGEARKWIVPAMSATWPSRFVIVAASNVSRRSVVSRPFEGFSLNRSVLLPHVWAVLGTSSLQDACYLRGSPLKWSVLPLRFHGENGQHRRFSHEMAAAAERGSPGAPSSSIPTGEVNCPGSGRNPPRSTCLAFDTTGGGQVALGTPYV